MSKVEQAKVGRFIEHYLKIPLHWYQIIWLFGISSFWIFSFTIRPACFANIYISSAAPASHWMGKLLKDTVKSRFTDKRACMLATDYSIALKHNIKTKTGCAVPLSASG